MKILTLGDSFTYGEELQDTNTAWPYLLAQRLHGTVSNLGRPAQGNTRMARECVLSGNEYDLVIIAWSHFARIEFSDEKGTYDIWPGSNTNMFTHPDVTFRQELVSYITRHYSDEYLYNQYLLNILSCQRYLEQYQVRYVFLDAFDNNEHRHLGNHRLQQQINPNYYLGWPNETMMEWTYGCSQGPRGHFLDQGHIKVADKIYEHIRHLSWVS